MTKMIRFFRLYRSAVLVVAGGLLLSGCGTMVQIHRDTAETFHQAADEAQRQLDARPVLQSTARPDQPHISHYPYVSTTAVEYTEALPLAFQRIVTLNEPLGAPMRNLAPKIEAITGVAIEYESGLSSTGAAPPAQAAASAPSPAGVPEVAGLPPLPMPALGALPGASDEASVALTYTGSVKGLLDAVAAGLGAQWRWDPVARRVHLYRYVTETFRIAMVPGGSRSTASVGAETGGSSSANSRTSTATAETTFESDGVLSVWKGLGETVKQMLSSAGTFTVSESIGTVTVRDRWDRVDAVRDYIAGVNAMLSRQVEFDVRVYSIANSDSDTRGLNWNVAFNALAAKGGYNVELLTPRPDTTGQGVSSAVITVPETFRDGRPRPYGGSQAFIDAMSLLGKTSVVTSTSLQTINNQPAPMKIVKRIKYLESVTPLYAGTAGSAVGAGAQLTPGEVETGFKMQILPHVQDDGKRVLLQVMMSLSTLDAMEEKSSGGQTIQLPQVSSREFMRRVWLTQGQALVLAGFENVTSQSDLSTPLDKHLWGVGGSRKEKHGKESIVVVITPAVSVARSAL